MCVCVCVFVSVCGAKVLWFVGFSLGVGSGALSLCAGCRRKTMPLPRETLKTPNKLLNTPITEILWFLGFSLGIGSGAGAGSSSSSALSLLAVNGR